MISEPAGNAAGFCISVASTCASAASRSLAKTRRITENTRTLRRSSSLWYPQNDAAQGASTTRKECKIVTRKYKKNGGAVHLVSRVRAMAPKMTQHKAQALQEKSAK